MANTFVPAAGQAPAANTDAVATLAAPADGSRWVLSGLLWSYSAPPAVGSKITITWSGKTITLYVAGGGPGSMTFPEFRFPPNTLVTITLLTGGAGIFGTIYPIAETRAS